MGITARILRQDVYDKGYDLLNDPDLVELTFKGEVIARFNPTRVTIQTLNDTADQHYNQLMSGIEFERVN